MNNISDAFYLLRFDDICPTMKWSNWEPIEAVLSEHDIRPIMAVVPDNRDPDLYFDAPKADFWNRVRSWQAAGWTIGLHGYQHVSVTRRPGLYSYRTASEFAGVPAAVQRDKLVRALAILRSEGVTSNVWVAPGHSFDRITVGILRELGITNISDGFTVSPYTDKHGTFWIPQQLSEVHILSGPGRKSQKPRSAGGWTVCCHINSWTKEDIKRFQRNIPRYRSLIRTVDEIHAAYVGREMDWSDRVQVVESEFRRMVRLVRFLCTNRTVTKDIVRYQAAEITMPVETAQVAAQAKEQ